MMMAKQRKIYNNNNKYKQQESFSLGNLERVDTFAAFGTQ